LVGGDAAKGEGEGEVEIVVMAEVERAEVEVVAVKEEAVVVVVETGVTAEVRGTDPEGEEVVLAGGRSGQHRTCCISWVAVDLINPPDGAAVVAAGVADEANGGGTATCVPANNHHQPLETPPNSLQLNVEKSLATQKTVAMLNCLLLRPIRNWTDLSPPMLISSRPTMQQSTSRLKHGR
jgi:hypothetical protein